MAILKEKDAVEYLTAVKNCIHPDDNFSHLQMVKKMLEIEAAFIQRLMEDRRELASVRIDATGFPKLEDWWTDIKLAFSEYDQVRLQRKRLMEPFSQQLLNANSEGIAAQAINVAKTFSSEHLFGAAFKGVSGPQRNFLLKGSGEEKVIYLDPIYPGRLMSIHRTSAFQAKNFYPDAPNYHKFGYCSVDSIQAMPVIPLKAGLKFIGSRAPFIIYTDVETGKIQILDSNALLKRCGKKNIQSIKLDEHGHPLTCQTYRRRGSADGQVDYITEDIEAKDLTAPWERNEIEKKFEGLHPGLLRTFLEADLYGADSETLVNMLPELNMFMADTLDFLQTSVNAQISGEEFIAGGQRLGKKTGEIFGYIEDNKLRTTLQLFMAEAAKPVIGPETPAKETTISLMENCSCAACRSTFEKTLPTPTAARKKIFGIF
ncbi:hypothetical protein HYW46_01775 [Candidatus Daviesbacteria bacterium]|nr:hypothetical protein [Candidatus Daviesbacteria bacterium]